MLPKLPPSWNGVIGEELGKQYFRKLGQFVEGERRSHAVYPPEREIFAALKLTPPTEA